MQFDKNVSKYMTNRCFKQFNESSFVNKLLSFGILEVETLDDPNIALAHLTSVLKCTLDKHALIKRKKVKLPKQPEWITNTILDAKKQREYWFRKKRTLINVENVETCIIP